MPKALQGGVVARQVPAAYDGRKNVGTHTRMNESDQPQPPQSSAPGSGGPPPRGNGPTCANCGASLSPTARFCDSCGTRVPEAPQHIRGVTNLRGRILPVVELRSRLGLAPLDTPGPRARIIVVETDGRILGLLVDSVSHVLKVTAGMVIDAPAEVTSAQGNYVTGVARIDSRLVILLDLDRALLPALA